MLHGGYVLQGEGDPINQVGNKERIILSDTWEYDGENWQLVSEDGPPIAFHAMAYDPARGVTVLFGGAIPYPDPEQPFRWQFKGETWIWDGEFWDNYTNVSDPLYRASASMEYDPVSQSIIMLGGNMGGNARSDTWSWDGSRWNQLVAEDGPMLVTDRITYDENRQKITAMPSC